MRPAGDVRSGARDSGGHRRAGDDAAVSSGLRSIEWPSVAVRGAVVLACMVSIAVVVNRAQDRIPVLAVAQKVEAGQVIESVDLREASLSRSSALDTIPANERSRVVGKVALVTLMPGATLSPDAVGPTSAAVGPEEATVGVSLKVGTYPDGLRAGDTVRVVDSGSGSVLGDRADPVTITTGRVRSVRELESGAEGAVTVALVVPASSAATVAAGAAAGRIALAVVGSV